MSKKNKKEMDLHEKLEKMGNGGVSEKLNKWKELNEKYDDINMQRYQSKGEKQEAIVETQILEVDKDVRSYLKIISEQNKTYKIILRGMLTGVCFAFGSTIIFAIMLLALTSIFKSAHDLPIIGKWITESGIEKIIDRN